MSNYFIMENQAEEFEEDSQKDVDSPTDSSKLLVKLRKKVSKSPKCENDFAGLPCTSHANKMNTLSASKEVIACSTRSFEDRRKTMSYQVNHSGSEMEVSDHTYVKILNRTDSGKSVASMTQPEEDYMTKMENFIKNFDIRRVDLNSSKKEEPDVSLELINLSVGSDKTTERNDRIEALMSWNLVETKKFHAHNNLDGEQNAKSEQSIRKSDLVHILLDNALLEKATSELRTQFKQFFGEFDLKTDTLTSSQEMRHIFKPSTNYGVGKFGKNIFIQTNTNLKMSILKLIENSRQSRKKKSDFPESFKSDQQLLPIKKHFDRDGFCIRIDGHDEVLTLHSEKLSDKDRMIRRAMASFLRTYSKADRMCFNLEINASREMKSIEYQGEYVTEKLDDMPTKEEIIYSKTGIQCSNSNEDDFIGPFSSKETSLNERSKPSKIRGGVRIHTCGILNAIPTNNSSKLLVQDGSSQRINSISNDSNVSTQLESSSCGISERCEKVLDSYPSISLIGSSDTTTTSTTKTHNSRNISTEVLLGNKSSSDVEISNPSLLEIEGVSNSKISNLQEDINGGWAPPSSQHFEEVQDSCSSNNNIASSNTKTTEEISYNSTNILEDQNRMEETCLNVPGSEIIFYKNEESAQSNVLSKATDVLQGNDSLHLVEHSNSSTLKDDSKTYPKVSSPCEGICSVRHNQSTEHATTNIRSSPMFDAYQEETLCGVMNIAERRRQIEPVEGGSSQISDAQKFSNIHSLPVGGHQLSWNESLSFSEEVCTNLQSTCVYFDERKEIDDLMTVVLQKETDINDVLEKVADYEDFVNPLLFNTRQVSASNQTC